MKWAVACLAILLFSCGHRTEQYVLPDNVTDFAALYGTNCAGCHGPDGRNGAARPLNDPLYLALIGKEKLRDVIANGVPRTAMPAFAQNAGGTLTDQQVSLLANQIEQRWSRAQDFGGVALPPYSADLGDADRGEAVFRTYCLKCHADDKPATSIFDPAFLSLVSDQSLRTTVIAGRVDRSSPDWRQDAADRALTLEEICDVVAWLASHRTPPGNLLKGELTLR
jgi:mono/diheme cytochrome c family protein